MGGQEPHWILYTSHFSFSVIKFLRWENKILGSINGVERKQKRGRAILGSEKLREGSAYIRKANPFLRELSTRMNSGEIEGVKNEFYHGVSSS